MRAKHFFAATRLRSVIARSVAGMLLALASSIAIAGQARLTWTAPTLNDDGTLYTDPSHYTIRAGCQQSGQYEQQTISNIPHGVTSLTVSALPEGGSCYFVATATNQQGIESVYSGEAVKFISSTLELPGVVADLQVSWQESNTEPPVVTIVTDNFTATDGTQLEVYNSNWSITRGAVDIQGNAIAGDAAGRNIAKYDGVSWDPDQYAEAVVSTLGGNQNVGPAIRCNASGSCYAAEVDNSSGGSLYPAKITNGVFGYQTGYTAKVTNLGVTSGDVVRIEATGSTIRTYLNGDLITTSTDTSFTEGNPGVSLSGDGAVNRLDDWEGGDSAAGGGDNARHLAVAVR